MSSKFTSEELATLLDLVVLKRKEQLEKMQYKDKIKNWLENIPLKTLEDKLRKFLLGESTA